MEAFNNYLKQFPGYSQKAFDAMLPYLSTKELVAGGYFLEQGKICRNIAYIEKGLFRLFYLNDGKDITDCFCKENTVTTSYSSLITQKESDIAIQALEDSKIHILSYDNLQKLYAQDAFWQQVGRMMSENEFIITESHNKFVRNIAAEDRYKHFLENDSALLQRIPLQHLASYLNMTPETLSRIRKKLSQT